MVGRCKSRGLAASALSVAAALALVGCSGGSAQDTPSGSGTPDGSAAPADDGKWADEVAWAEENIPGIDPELVRGACEEGALTIYHMVYRDDLAPLRDAFAKTFPCISVTGFSATASELVERLRSEQQAGRYETDVFQTTTPGVAPALLEEGILTEYTPPNADRVPDEFKTEGLFYATGIDPIGIAWNTELVTPEEQAVIDSITDWDQVADPVFKDDIGMVNARSGGTAQIAWWYFQQKAGPGFYEKIAALNPIFFDATRPSVDRLVAGDFAYLMHAPVDNSVAAAWVNGAPVQWKFPEPGVAVPAVATVLEKAPHPNAARLFLTWSLSAEGQSQWSAATGLVPIGPDVTDERPQASESWYELPEKWLAVDWVEVTENVPSTIDDFTRIFGQ